jgi:hypothetical protein
MLQVKVCKTSLKMFFLISTSLKGQSDSFQQKINFHLGFMFLSITFELFQINKTILIILNLNNKFLTLKLNLKNQHLKITFEILNYCFFVIPLILKNKI